MKLLEPNITLRCVDGMFRTGEIVCLKHMLIARRSPEWAKLFPWKRRAQGTADTYKMALGR